MGAQAFSSQKRWVPARADAQDNPKLFPKWTTFRQYEQVASPGEGGIFLRAAPLYTNNMYVKRGPWKMTPHPCLQVTGAEWPFVNTTLGMNTWTVFGVTPADTGRTTCYMDRGVLQYDDAFDIHALAGSQEWVKSFTAKIRAEPKLQALPARDQNRTFLEHFEAWQNSSLTHRVAKVVSTLNKTGLVAAWGDLSACLRPFPLPPNVFEHCFKLWTDTLTLGIALQVPEVAAKFENMTRGFPKGVASQLKASLVPPATCPAWQCLGMLFGPQPANAQLRVVWLQTSTHFRPDWNYKRMAAFWQHWEDFIRQELKDAPVGFASGWFHSYWFLTVDLQYWMHFSALESAALAMLLAFLVLLGATRSFTLTVQAVWCIGAILGWVLAILVLMGWSLGVLESMCMSIAVGVCVDFICHHAHSYQHSGLPTNDEKVLHSLSEMGISVWSAAATTLIASLVLWTQSELVFFEEFGAFLTICMLVSVSVALTYFHSVIAIGGNRDAEVRQWLHGRCGRGAAAGTEAVAPAPGGALSEPLTAPRE
jgi:hypothetical protein